MVGHRFTANLLRNQQVIFLENRLRFDERYMGSPFLRKRVLEVTPTAIHNTKTSTSAEKKRTTVTCLQFKI